MSAGTIDVEFEREVLAASLRDPVFTRKAFPVLRAHHFSDSTYQWIWGVIAETYGGSRELPSPVLWRERLEADYPDEAKREYAIETILDLRRRPVKASGQALETIRKFVRMTALRRSLYEAAEKLSDGDLDEAEAAFGRGKAEARGAALLTDPTDWIATAQARLARYKDPGTKIAIRFPIPSLTAAMNGGLKPGHMAIIAANTNVGKSSFAVDCGFVGLVHSQAIVIHVTTEETEAECTTRYDARFTEINREKLENGDLSPDDEALFVEKFRRRMDLAGRQRIFELPPGSTVAAVTVLVEQAREDFPEAMIYVVLDSPDHLKPSDKAENYRLEQTGVFWELKALAEDPTLAPLAVTVTVQATKETAGKKTIRPEDLAESYNKGRIASFVVGLVEGDDPGGGPSPYKTIEMWVGKNRLGKKKKFRVYAQADLAICKFEEVATHEPAEA